MKKLFLILLLICGCIDNSPNKLDNISNISIVEIDTLVKNQVNKNIYDYGNGIYYFDCTGARFGNTLSIWVTRNPDKRIISVTENTIDYTLGYFVITESNDKN